MVFIFKHTFWILAISAVVYVIWNGALDGCTYQEAVQGVFIPYVVIEIIALILKQLFRDG